MAMAGLAVHDMEPVALRYRRIAPTTAFPPGYFMGVFAAGKAFRPELPEEYGGGRPIIDTGTATRVFGGGFAIDEAARAGGWQWTLSELSDAERSRLYAIVWRMGQTRTLLVVEDPDQTDGLNERIHWSLVGKIDPYERRDANLNRYAMSVLDWA